MAFLDGNDSWARWFSGTEPEINLVEAESIIVLRRDSSMYVLSVQLTRHAPLNIELETWMRLGAASLNHFAGALAQAPADGTLWLIHCLEQGQDQKKLLQCLEALLNQRDTWLAVIPRLSRLRREAPSLSRYSLSRYLENNHE
ncbi:MULTISPECIES: type III secretion protein [Pseudomonas fluorescens group]|uniref:Type III secretion protein n=1 Tax=Pseudomonas fluorescens TaxID=294 RepID=A0AAE2Q1W9_PSEFL|nr:MULTISPECIES: type III secretion protein [Pseudomonas fluorescens group]MBD8272428.1 type III secretion protein [Pseudomonas fluorescens]UOB24764.1 type III secretion protein [Pseudomonas orientalis]